MMYHSGTALFIPFLTGNIMKKIFFISLAIIRSYIVPLSAQSTPLDTIYRGQLRTEVAQDWFVDWWKGHNFDRNYTQGTGFSYSKNGLHESLLFMPLNRLIDWSEERFNTNESEWQELTARIGMGVTAFTPRIIDSKEPIVGDRPFANVVFLTTERSYYLPKQKKLVHISFNYGLIGTNIANSFQSFAHKNIIKGRPFDISWEHQISNGGRFSFLFSHQAIRPVADILLLTKDTTAKERSRPQLRVGATISTNLDIGWYNSLGSTFTIRLGKYAPLGIFDASILDNGNKIIPDDDESRNCKKSSNWNWYVFGAVTPRLTPYNALILGQFGRNDKYALPNKDYTPFILDIRYGITCSFKRVQCKNNRAIVSRYDLIATLNHRSPEINNTAYKRWHHWGEISLAVPVY